MYKVKFGIVFCLVFFFNFFGVFFYSCSVPFYGKLVLRYTWTSGWDCLKLRFFVLGWGWNFHQIFCPNGLQKNQNFTGLPMEYSFYQTLGNLSHILVFFSLKNCSFRIKLKPLSTGKTFPSISQHCRGG